MKLIFKTISFLFSVTVGVSLFRPKNTNEAILIIIMSVIISAYYFGWGDSE